MFLSLGKKASRRVWLLLVALTLCACASARVEVRAPRAPLGELDLGYRAPITAPATSAAMHAVFSVEDGRIAAPWLKLATKRDDEDCVAGCWSGNALALCAESVEGKGKRFGGELVRWSGPTGDLVIESAPDGSAMRAFGRLFLGDDGSYRALDRSAPLALHPARYSQIDVTLPLKLGPQWDALRETPILYVVAAVSVGLSADPPVAPAFRPLGSD